MRQSNPTKIELRFLRRASIATASTLEIRTIAQIVIKIFWVNGFMESALISVLDYYRPEDRSQGQTAC
jgi:hypothetical protein